MGDSRVGRSIFARGSVPLYPRVGGPILRGYHHPRQRVLSDTQPKVWGPSGQGLGTLSHGSGTQYAFHWLFWLIWHSPLLSVSLLFPNLIATFCYAMTKEQLQSILEHSSISKEYLEALARAVDACEEPDTLKKEFLVAALMEVEVDRVVPWLKILPERAVEGVDFSEVDRETSEDAVVPEADPDPGQQNSTTESADRASEAKKTHIIALREALDKSSKVNRSLGLSFVALMFYILLIIASTTDLMLFLPDEKVNLPIVDVELPLKGFYAVTPFLVLIFHFNLLINLYHHRKRFIALREAESYNFV